MQNSMKMMELSKRNKKSYKVQKSEVKRPDIQKLPLT